MVYFLYSDEHVKEKNKILAKCGKQFVPGTIIIMGKRYNYSYISDIPYIDRFIDTKVIASFDSLDQATYTSTNTISIRGD